jgi:hypothetical protein
MSATLRGLGLCIDDLNSTFAATNLPVNPGTIVEDDTGHRFMFVYNTGSTSITQYYPAFHTSTGTSGYVASAGLSALNVAGVAMTAIDSANGGWVCIRGFCTAQVYTTITTTGFALIGSTAALGIYTAAGDFVVGQAVTVRAGIGTIIAKLAIG